MNCMKVRSTFLASSVLSFVAMFVLLASVARADEPQEWPDFAKETVGGVANGGTEAQMVKAFGKAKTKDKAVEEGATGEWASVWTFPDGVSAVMTAAKEKGPYTVRVITVTAPSKAQTSKKIGIGSSLADLKKAYGKLLSDNSDGNWLVGTPYAGIALHVEKDKVASFSFGVMAE